MGADKDRTADPCPFTPAVEVIFPRWTSHVLWVLSQHGRLRFSELRELMPGVTPKVLTERLRRLERDGLVHRTYYAQVPPRVVYEITDLARSIVPLLQQLSRWAEEHLKHVHDARAAFDSAAESTGR